MSYPNDPTRRFDRDPAPAHVDYDDAPRDDGRTEGPEVIREPGRLAAGVAAAAVVAALLAWILRWVHAWVAHIGATGPIPAPVVWPAIVSAVLLTAVGAGVLVFLALFAPRAPLFFGLLAVLSGTALALGPIMLADSFTWATAVRSIGNGLLALVVAMLLLAVAAQTVDLAAAEHRTREL